jgi:hypothetical protein
MNKIRPQGIRNVPIARKYKSVPVSTALNRRIDRTKPATTEYRPKI